MSEVFAWKRLYSKAIWAAVLTVGLFVLSPLALGELETGGKAIQEQEVTYTPSFALVGDTSEIWFEQNILLQNTIWPRRCMLELLDFPSSGELKIGKGEAPPTVRVPHDEVRDRRRPARKGGGRCTGTSWVPIPSIPSRTHG